MQKYKKNVKLQKSEKLKVRGEKCGELRTGVNRGLLCVKKGYYELLCTAYCPIETHDEK